MLTLPASAHHPKFTATCDTTNHQMVLTIDLEQYAKGSEGQVNTITATDQPAGGKLITLIDAGTKFDTTFTATFNASSKPATGSAEVKNTFVVTVKAWDDPNGDKGFTTTFTQDVDPCVKTPPTTTTAPPTTTTTVAPPTTHATTTTTAVVAAASSQLPNTGVNAGMPLLIAGVLVVAGGGILLWLRLAAKRRSTNS